MQVPRSSRSPRDPASTTRRGDAWPTSSPQCTAPVRLCSATSAVRADAAYAIECGADALSATLAGYFGERPADGPEPRARRRVLAGLPGPGLRGGPHRHARAGQGGDWMRVLHAVIVGTAITHPTSPQRRFRAAPRLVGAPPGGLEPRRSRGVLGEASDPAQRRRLEQLGAQYLETRAAPLPVRRPRARVQSGLPSATARAPSASATSTSPSSVSHAAIEVHLRVGPNRGDHPGQRVERADRAA